MPRRWWSDRAFCTVHSIAAQSRWRVCGMSESFTRKSRPPARVVREARQNNGLRSNAGRGMTLALTHHASLQRSSFEGCSPYHGLDLVDRLGVPDWRLRRHVARRIGHSCAKGEGARLARTHDHYVALPVNGRRRSCPMLLSRVGSDSHCASGCACPRMRASSLVGRGQVMEDIALQDSARPAGPRGRGPR